MSDLNTISDRELFDRVKNHLLTQEQPAVDHGTSPFGNPKTMCVYRDGIDPDTGDYLRCAIGVLIDDSLYHESIEGQGVQDELIIELVEISLGVQLTNKQRELLIRLQSIHDGYVVEDKSAMNIAVWSSMLDNLEKEFGI